MIYIPVVSEQDCIPLKKLPLLERTRALANLQKAGGANRHLTLFILQAAE